VAASVLVGPARAPPAWSMAPRFRSVSSPPAVGVSTAPPWRRQHALSPQRLASTGRCRHDSAPVQWPPGV